MTIGTSNRNDADGNNTATTFPYGFKIFAATDLEVKVRDSSGAETTLTYPTHYSVTGVGARAGGNVVLADVDGAWQNAADGTLKTGYHITIRRVRPLTQTTDIRNAGGFFADSHEDTFDHLIMIDQQQQDEIDRALKIPTTEDGTAALTTLPALTSRTGKILGFDADGNPTVYDPNVTVYGVLRDYQVATAGQTVFNLGYNYSRGVNAMAVFVNGVRQRITADFTESADNQVTFTYGLVLGDEVEFYAGQEQGAAVADAAAITYTPSGAGAVATNVRDKLRESVSVKDFGAVGDGVTDDTAAINAAVAALVTAGGGTLYFPEGTYIVSAPINLRSNIVYQGHGWASIIKQKAAVTGVNLLGEASPAAPHSNIIVRDLQLDGNRANANFPADDADGNAIRLNQVSFSRFENLYIHDSIFNGISVYNASNDNIITKNRLEDIGKTGSPPGAATYTGIFIEFGANRNRVSQNRISTTRQYGIWIGSRDADNYDNAIENNFVNAAAGDGIRVGDDVSANITNRPLVIGNHVLSCGDLGIRLFHAGTGSIQDGIVIGNHALSNTNGGIYAQAGSLRTLVSGNISRSNGGYGLSGAGTDNIFTSNISLSNTSGQIQIAGTRTVDLFNITFAQTFPYSEQEIRSGTKLSVSRASGNDCELDLDQSGVVAWHLRNTATTGLLQALFGATTALEIQRSPANGNVGLAVYRNVGGSLTLEQVSMGAVDSGGAGFKLLRVPN
jgi:hypothetical protein